MVPESQELLFLEEEINVSPWILRLTLDAIKMNRKAVGLKEVVQRKRDYLTENLQGFDSLETEFDFFDIKKIKQLLWYDLVIKDVCKIVSYRKNEVKMYSDYGVVTDDLKKEDIVPEITGANLN